MEMNYKMRLIYKNDKSSSNKQRGFELGRFEFKPFLFITINNNKWIEYKINFIILIERTPLIFYFFKKNESKLLKI